jgi:hypothetical protein
MVWDASLPWFLGCGRWVAGAEGPNHFQKRQLALPTAEFNICHPWEVKKLCNQIFPVVFELVPVRGMFET